jgi:hypothetical protein
MSRIRTATRLPPSSFGRKMSQRLLQYTRPGSNSPTASTSPERLRPLPSPAIAILPPTCPHFHPLWWAAGPWDSPEKHVRTPAIFARHSPSSVFSSLLMGRRPMGHSLWSRLGRAGLNGERSHGLGVAPASGVAGLHGERPRRFPSRDWRERSLERGRDTTPLKITLERVEMQGRR